MKRFLRILAACLAVPGGWAAGEPAAEGCALKRNESAKREVGPHNTWRGLGQLDLTCNL